MSYYCCYVCHATQKYLVYLYLKESWETMAPSWCHYIILFLQAYDHFLKSSQPDPDFIFTCNVCTKVFLSNRVLRNHMFVHRKEYQCPQCPIKAISPSTIKVHIRNMHMITERLYSCETCEFKGKDHNSIKSHMKTHTERQCIYCNCGFTSKMGIKQTLEKHYREAKCNV